ncbi:hypothetical protein FKM82_022038 [Ascaphus truei]
MGHGLLHLLRWRLHPVDAALKDMRRRRSVLGIVVLVEAVTIGEVASDVSHYRGHNVVFEESFIHDSYSKKRKVLNSTVQCIR